MQSRKVRLSAAGREGKTGGRRRTLVALPAWKLEDAKARLSEVVRRACTSGPQRVTRRGADAVVILSTDDFEALQPRRRPASLVRFLRGSCLAESPLVREVDRGRKPPL